jgi:hypothetical protein
LQIPLGEGGTLLPLARPVTLAVLLIACAPRMASPQVPSPRAPSMQPAPMAAGADRAGRWHMAAGARLGMHQMRDDLLTPLRFSGPAADLRLSLLRPRDGSPQRAELRLGFAYDRNRYGHRAAAASAGARVAGLKRVSGAPEAGTHLSFGLSGQLGVDQLYFFDWDDAHAYWLTIAAVGPAAAGEWNLGGRRVAASVELPSFGLYGRPPLERRSKVDDLVQVGTWFTLPFSRLEAAGPPELVALDARVDYTASARIGWHYELSLRTAASPRRVTVMEHLIGIEWRFR